MPPFGVGGGGNRNVPVYSLIAVVALVGLAVLGLAIIPLDAKTTPLFYTVIGLIVTTVPSLIAATFAERTARDVRNGLVEDKVRKGTHTALKESGVTDVVEATRKGDSTLVALQGIQALLEHAQESREAREAMTPEPVARPPHKKGTDT